MSRDSVSKRDSSLRGLKNARINKRSERHYEESKDASPGGSNLFAAYQNFADVKRENTVRLEDHCDLPEEGWTKEKTLQHNRNDLKQYDYNPVFARCEFPNKDGGTEANRPSIQDVERDNFVNKIEELDNKKKALSEVSIKPKKSLNSMVTKVSTPFTVAPGANKNEGYKPAFEDEYGRPQSSSLLKNDRESVDIWRASDDLDKNKRESQMTEPEQDMKKDELLDEWLRRTGRENGTIAEDVEAENAEETTHRVSKTSMGTVSSNRQSEIMEQEEEEEENELHKIHMLQSLQALQYMKGVPLPHINLLKDKWVYLPAPKQPHLKKTLIFDMDETLIHCVDDIEDERPQTVLDVVFEDGEVVEAGINVRPYAIE